MEELIGRLREIQAGFLNLARENSGPEPDAVSYNAFLISDACGKAADKLQREIPMETELEGGGRSLWYVCPVCHGNIDKDDNWCKHCGQKLKWSKI